MARWSVVGVEPMLAANSTLHIAIYPARDNWPDINLRTYGMVNQPCWNRPSNGLGRFFCWFMVRIRVFVESVF